MFCTKLVQWMLKKAPQLRGALNIKRYSTYQIRMDVWPYEND